MFERFTDKSRRVMVLAQEEARAADQDVIGTEHLLLALTSGETVAATVLATFNATPEFIRSAILTSRPPAKNPPSSPPFTINAKKALEGALRESLSLGHTYIGTEHLLLGILRTQPCSALAILASKGTDLVEMRAVAARLAGPPTNPPHPPLFEVVKSIGRRLRPDLSTSELDLRTTEIIKGLESDIESRWANPPTR